VNCGPVAGTDANGAALYNPCSPTNNVITHQNNTGGFGVANQTNTKAGRELQYTLKLSF
jgi:hypothetical protein